MDPAKLQPGDVIRATQGPYRVSANGKKSRFCHSGLMRFIRIDRDDKGSTILYAHQGMQEVRLILSRSPLSIPVDDSVVYREYKIIKPRKHRYVDRSGR